MAWDNAFETTPSGSDPGTVIPAKFADLKVAVRERIGLEHIMPLTSDDSHGVHKVGSARVFVDDATVTDFAPRTPNPLDDNLGKIVFKPTDGIMEVMQADPDGLKELQYVHIGDVNDTVAGVKTFTVSPIITESQLTGSEIKVGISTDSPAKIATMEARIMNEIDVLKGALFGSAGIIPVGFRYVQFPGVGTKTPDEMWGSLLKQGVNGDGAAATWVLITNDDDYLSSAFFRLNPTGMGVLADAQAFTAITAKNGSVPSHTHIYTRTPGVEDMPQGLGSTKDLAKDDSYSDPTGIPIGFDANLEVAAENRPRNVTVQVWKRTA